MGEIFTAKSAKGYYLGDGMHELHFAYDKLNTAEAFQRAISATDHTIGSILDASDTSNIVVMVQGKLDDLKRHVAPSVPEDSLFHLFAKLEEAEEKHAEICNNHLAKRDDEPFTPHSITIRRDQLNLRSVSASFDITFADIKTATTFHKALAAIDMKQQNSYNTHSYTVTIPNIYMPEIQAIIPLLDEGNQTRLRDAVSLRAMYYDATTNRSHPPFGPLSITSSTTNRLNTLQFSFTFDDLQAAQSFQQHVCDQQNPRISIEGTATHVDSISAPSSYTVHVYAASHDTGALRQLLDTQGQDKLNALHPAALWEPASNADTTSPMSCSSTTTPETGYIIHLTFDNYVERQQIAQAAVIAGINVSCLADNPILQLDGRDYTTITQHILPLLPSDAAKQTLQDCLKQIQHNLKADMDYDYIAGNLSLHQPYSRIWGNRDKYIQPISSPTYGVEETIAAIVKLSGFHKERVQEALNIARGEDERITPSIIGATLSRLDRNSCLTNISKVETIITNARQTSQAINSRR